VEALLAGMNVAVLAPIPIASENTAAVVTSGLFRSIRREYQRP
jgi:hypothetical protein